MGINDELLASYEVADFLVQYVQTAVANGVHFGAQGWGYPGGPCMCPVLDFAWRTQGWDEHESVYWRDVNNASRATRKFSLAFGLDASQVAAIIHGWDLLAGVGVWHSVGVITRLAYDRSLLPIGAAKVDVSCDVAMGEYREIK